MMKRFVIKLGQSALLLGLSFVATLGVFTPNKAIAMSKADILFNFGGVVDLIDIDKAKWNKNIRSVANFSERVLVRGDDATGVQMAALNNKGYEITNPIYSNNNIPDFIKYTVVFKPPHNTVEQRAVLENIGTQLKNQHGGSFKMTARVDDLPNDHGMALVVILCAQAAPKCPIR